MGDISEHFNRSEFACKCGCGVSAADAELLRVLEKVRGHFGSPVIITSGCRCAKHNAEVGGASESRHVAGIAADIVVKGVLPEAVARYLDTCYSDTYGIGRYRRWTHIDVRPEKARWSGK